MVYELDNKKINIPDKDIDHLMTSLSISKSEARECWLEDNDYLEPDEEAQALNEKAKKNIASWSQTYEYNTEVTPGLKEDISGMNVADGILKFDKFEGADEYRFIYTTKEGATEFWGFEKNEVDINQYIAQLVADDSLSEQSRYTIRIQAIKYGLTDAFDDPLILAEGSCEYDFAKASNPLKVSGKNVTVKYNKLRKKKQTVSAGKAIAGLSTARGKLTYTKASGNKKISVNKNTGKITIKKGLKKKTYKITVNVMASGNYGYDASEVQKVIITIKVK